MPCAPPVTMATLFSSLMPRSRIGHEHTTLTAVVPAQAETHRANYNGLWNMCPRLRGDDSSKAVRSRGASVRGLRAAHLRAPHQAPLVGGEVGAGMHRVAVVPHHEVAD